MKEIKMKVSYEKLEAMGDKPVLSKKLFSWNSVWALNEQKPLKVGQIV